MSECEGHSRLFHSPPSLPHNILLFFSFTKKRKEMKKKLTLNSRQPNSSRRRMHQHHIPSLHSRPHHQRAVARRRRHIQARGIPERPSLRHRQQRILLHAQLRGKSALSGTKDACADGEARRLAAAAFAGRGDDDAGEFSAGDPREG